MAELVPTSQNGWPVFDVGYAEGLSVIEHVTGRVVAGEVAVVFAWFCDRFAADVEPIDPAGSWGYAYRPIVGRGSGYSNHASGTAIDLNAPAHPIGVGDTFTTEQQTAIRRILFDADDVIRWGGDYSGRPDDMHFEINTGPAEVAALSERITALEVPMAVEIVTWGGRRYSAPMRDCVARWSELALAEGIPFRPTQGGFNRTVSASAGTHDGDAIDLSVYGLSEQQVSRLIEIGRMVGVACWFRTTDVAKWGTRAQGFGSYHIHGVPNGWGYPSAGARRQADSYRAGRDGLAANQLDRGPGHVSIYRNRTWEGYKRALAASQPSPGLPPTGVNNSTPEPQEDDMSAAEVAEIKAHIDAALEIGRKQVQDSAGIIGGRDAMIAQARTVWDDQHVSRAGKLVSVKQELADAKTNTTLLLGQVAGLTSALNQLAAGQEDIDYGRIKSDVKAAIREAEVANAKVTLGQEAL